MSADWRLPLFPCWSRRYGALYCGVVAAVQSDPELAQAFRDRIIAPRVTACIGRLLRAQRAGELRDDVDLEAVVELLYGSIYYRLLLQTRPLVPAQVDTVLDLAFDGLKR